MNARVRFLIALALIVFLIVLGLAGYSVIEGWSLSDSLYMTFITLTTVGFGEVRPLSDAGRYFTVVFIIIGIGTAGFAITTLIGFVFEGPMMQAVKERRMELIRRKIRGHYIICGCGDVGREVVNELSSHGVRYIVIDKTPDQNVELPDKYSVLINGDATDEAVLQKARIAEAEGLVATLSDDAANLFLVLTARQMNPKLRIVAKAATETAAKKIVKAGADRVVTPDQIAGRRIASTILRPQVVNFLEVMVDSGDMALRIEEFVIPEDSPLAGMTLRDANIGQNTGAIILAIVGPDGTTRYNPTGQSGLAGLSLRGGDILIAMGSEGQLQALDHFLENQKKSRRK